MSIHPVKLTKVIATVGILALSACGGVEQLKNIVIPYDESIVYTETEDYLAVGLRQDLLFEPGSTQFKPRLWGDLEQMAREIVRYKYRRVEVFSQAGKAGAGNRALEERQVAAVAALLVQNGVPSNWIELPGPDANQSTASNQTRRRQTESGWVKIIILTKP